MKMIESILIPEDRMEKLKDKRLEYNRKLANFFDAKISVNDEVEIEGDDPLAVMRSKEIVKAFGRGFDFEDALDLVDEDYLLEVISTSDFNKSRKRQIELKGRVIGSQGKSKNIIEKYSGAKIAVYGKTVSIIGKWDNIKLAREAVEMLLSGSRHSTVFKFLEERKIV
jgi:ribosomal RNA assembly protein